MFSSHLHSDDFVGVMKPFQRGYYQREKEKRKVFLTPLFSPCG
jgi:hypothetical protein